MTFNSIEFALFFPIVAVLYFTLPHRLRWILLLAASCLFYMAFIPAYILILAFTIMVDYIAGRGIEAASGRRRTCYLLCSLAANLGVLAVFKYANFASTNFAALARWLGWNYPLPILQVILPIGLSFHTFQAMSYTIEVYRKRCQAEWHLGVFALYVMFFPQLVAGPIERPQALLPQFREPHAFEYARVVSGLQLMSWGFVKKVVVADRLAIPVNAVFGHPRDFSPLSILLATIAFAYQIYCDFSGYTDIARGTAQVLGFRLSQNFNRPYGARSIAEFWRRWHMSLSSWFRDYLYILLGGNRVSPGRWALNVLIVFCLSGLWHGANWTFLVWGALHASYLLLSRWTAAVRHRLVQAIGLERMPWLHHALQTAMTFGGVLIGWIVFRAASLSEAYYLMQQALRGAAMLVVFPFNSGMARGVLASTGLNKFGWGLAALSLITLEGIQWVHHRHDLRQWISGQPMALRWTCYYSLATVLVLCGIYGASPFIYFQF